NIYVDLFSTSGKSVDGDKPVIEMIHVEARGCLKLDGGGINLENKIVLSIAIRLAAERFMVEKIREPQFVASITADQTPKLLEKFKKRFGSNVAAIETIQRVILMTPENIHLNSFMYEPILDMSDDHLRKLYKDVSALK
ncbi:MAG: hypothetical protein KF722_16570, partial [Nitrospira sp.]|nr:hypothetical protein [Nitrospira sp.]